MRVDPFADRLNLKACPRGGWQWKAGTHEFTEMSFKTAAHRLLMFRLTNHQVKATYPEAEMDILLYNRKRLGKQVQEAAVKTEAESPLAKRIREFKARRYRGGCKSCGKKRRFIR